MSVQTKEILKSYFETGDKPTQAQFADLIDSCFNLPELGNRTATVSEIDTEMSTVLLTISGSESQLRHTVTYLYTYLTDGSNKPFICGTVAFVHDTPSSTITGQLLYFNAEQNQQYIATFMINAYNTAYVEFLNTNIHTEFTSIQFIYVGCAYATY